MSDLSFEQATPAVSADASGTAVQATEQQAQSADKQAQEKDVTAILQKRVDDSQAFIKKLQTEMAQLKAEVEKAKKLEDVLSHKEDYQEQHQPVTEKQSSLDPEELLSKAEERVLKKLEQSETQRKEKENFQYVASVLAESLGREGLDEKIAKIAAENGMSYDDVKEMAKTKPKVVLKLFDVKPQSAPSASVHKSSVNPVAVAKQSQSKEPKFNAKDPKSKQEWIQWQLKQIQS